LLNVTCKKIDHCWTVTRDGYVFAFDRHMSLNQLDSHDFFKFNAPICNSNPWKFLERIYRRMEFLRLPERRKLSSLLRYNVKFGRLRSGMSLLTLLGEHLRQTVAFIFFVSRSPPDHRVIITSFPAIFTTGDSWRKF
jgi:hypothetical protein